MNYAHLSLEDRKKLLQELNEKYNEYCSRGLSLDLSRGKPNSDQLDISLPLLSESRPREKCFSESGIDCRNYGGLDGIIEMKRLFSDMLGIKMEYIYVGGNSSLQLMYDTLARAMLFGVLGSARPWCKEEGLKWICVAPGYDRHFKITEVLGFELITVPMLPTGPDMDMVEALVKDPKVKGMWCVPKYSNPTGTTYSDEIVKRIAALKPAAKDFRIMWDNAYAMHFLDADNDDKLLSILDECEKAGNPDLAVMFSSTSKITFSGGGIAAIAASKHNLDLIKARMTIQTISGDKLNQLRHARMFPNPEALREHMKKHAASLKPKFEVVVNTLQSELGDLGIISWTEPKGGYFVSADTLPGCAKRVVGLCKDAGLVLTGAGATYPYGNDPLDNNIRIAPSFPPVDELKTAMKLFTVAVKKATLEMLIEQ